MQVTDGLTAVLSAIIYHTVAVAEVVFFGDFCNRFKHLGNINAVFRRYFVSRADMDFGTITA